VSIDRSETQSTGRRAGPGWTTHQAQPSHPNPLFHHYLSFLDLERLILDEIEGVMVLLFPPPESQPHHLMFVILPVLCLCPYVGIIVQESPYTLAIYVWGDHPRKKQKLPLVNCLG
jgi:hypothetical protein